MNQWLTEKILPGINPDHKISIEIKKKIASFRGKYQKIEVFDTSFYGRMLVLDGIFNLAEKDEFIYHEMMAHLPLFSFANSEKVLIIGGGDGGILREVLKHKIKEVYLVDIDKDVIEISKKYLPFVHQGAFENKKAKVIIGDGIKFIKEYKNYFDVVIIDSTDPSKSSAGLFAKSFYKGVFNALTKQGIIIAQTGGFLEQIREIKKVFDNLKTVFPFVKIHRVCIPCYGNGEFSLTMASKNNLKKIDFKIINDRYKKSKLKTKYYSPEIHITSGFLPQYLKEKLI